MLALAQTQIPKMTDFSTNTNVNIWTPDFAVFISLKKKVLGEVSRRGRERHTSHAKRSSNFERKYIGKLAQEVRINNLLIFVKFYHKGYQFTVSNK